MNILFLLTPKINTNYLLSSYTIRQTAEKFFIHNYTALPVIDDEGKYIRTVSEGDIFRYQMQKIKKSINEFNKINILELDEERVIKSVRNDATMDELYDLIIQQNFIPVVDDRGVYIGIITRKRVIEYLKKNIKND